MAPKAAVREILEDEQFTEDTRMTKGGRCKNWGSYVLRHMPSIIR